VEKGSPAEAAGFRAGDVIIRLDNEKIADRGDWRSTLRSRKPGKATVGIIRDKREQSLTLEIPENKSGQMWRHMDLPDLDLNVDLDELGTALDALQPELQEATRDALEQSHMALVLSGKEFDRYAEALKQSQKAIVLSREEMQRSIDKAMKEAQRQMKCYQEQMRKMQWHVDVDEQ